jgi:hypothetical protein
LEGTCYGPADRAGHPGPAERADQRQRRHPAARRRPAYLAGNEGPRRGR